MVRGLEIQLAALPGPEGQSLGDVAADLWSYAWHPTPELRRQVLERLGQLRARFPHSMGATDRLATCLARGGPRETRERLSPRK